MHVHPPTCCIRGSGSAGHIPFLFAKLTFCQRSRLIVLLKAELSVLRSETGRNLVEQGQADRGPYGGSRL